MRWQDLLKSPENNSERKEHLVGQWSLHWILHWWRHEPVKYGFLVLFRTLTTLQETSKPETHLIWKSCSASAKSRDNIWLPTGKVNSACYLDAAAHKLPFFQFLKTGYLFLKIRQSFYTLNKLNIKPSKLPTDKESQHKHKSWNYIKGLIQIIKTNENTLPINWMFASPKFIYWNLISSVMVLVGGAFRG